MPPEDEEETVAPAPQYVTADQIGNIVNAAVSSHLKRSLGTAIEAAMKPITEKLAAAPPPPPADDETKRSHKKQPDPEFLALTQKLAGLENDLKTERERVAAEQKKSSDDRAYNTLRSSLENKIRPELLDMVTSHLFRVEKRVTVDEQGNPLFRSQRIAYTGAEPEDVDLPLRSGVDEFLKSDAAKPFLPAPGTSGASPMPKRGPSPNQGGIDFSKPATTDADKARRSIERERIANERLGNKSR